MALQVGLSTPFDFWDLTPAQQRARLGMIADAGIDHVFTADHVSFFDGSGLDALIHLAAMSGIEPRLGLHAGVFLLALRHPMVAARQIASLAQAAPGRLTVGVGVGGEDRHEIEVCGVDPSTRGRRTDAAMVIVRGLLDGGAVDGDGESFHFSQGRIRPKPNPRVPFLVGGRSDAALRRAGRLGDGWLAAWCSARRYGQGLATVEQIGAERDVRWQHGLQLWVGVGATAEEGRGHVAQTMQEFYKLDFKHFEKYTPIGSAADIAEYLTPLVECGGGSLNLTPCGPDPETEIETMAEVRKLLRP
ncbi:MAG: LLM class flavin-dependent oxidoreductase [Actinomycetia bacterium]|nr:LLM class flavin-dependent oxidoreductase [Actinomycetes bacterium]